jgi:tRNA threonylcarbamoyladenosine biosynthesis protein TsaE
MAVEIVTESAAQTRNVGRKFARILRVGDSVALTGELGSGKTVFVQGAVQGLGYKGHVTSPTFTLIHEYSADVLIRHFDCFRLHQPSDVLTAGIEDYLDGDGILFVEWADKIKDYFNQWLWEINFFFVNNEENNRRIRFRTSARTEAPDRIEDLKAILTGLAEMTP